MYIVCSISAWKTDQQRDKQKSAGFSTVPCWHLVSMTCKESLHHRRRNLGIPPEWLKDDLFLVSCCSCLLLIQLPVTSFVFPLTLPGFSVGLTLLDVILQESNVLGNGVFLCCFGTQLKRNQKLISAKTSCWNVRDSSPFWFAFLLHSLITSSLHTKSSHIISAFCWKAVVVCIPTPDLQGGTRPRDTRTGREAWPCCSQHCSGTMVINFKGSLRMLLFLVVQKVVATFSFVSWSLRCYTFSVTSPSPEKGTSSSLTLLWMCLLCTVLFFSLCSEHFNGITVKITSSKSLSTAQMLLWNAFNFALLSCFFLSHSVCFLTFCLPFVLHLH